MNKEQHRKLAAIMFCDIQGYTFLMQTNEQLALASLQKFKTQLDTQVPTHHGEIIQYYGDGCLAIFNSSVDATACAKSLQEAFQTKPKVPVRIGLHAGDVVLRDNNVFGDAVNIASRIESMGVPGSVLLSSTVQNQIYNQSTFDVSPLGKFEFKNVNKPTTVYALLGEGLIVPTSSELTGKSILLPEKKKKGQSKLSMMLGGILLLVLVGVLYVGWKKNWSSLDTPLTEAEREKRLAIPTFKNDTNDPSLDAFGIMVADWLTKALMNKEEVNIISAQNIEQQLAEINLSTSANASFANSTGVDIVVRGNYYQLENDLHISADILDIREGKVLHTLQLNKAIDQKAELLEELQQKLLSYWAVKNTRRFLERPPKYEAFQAYTEGSRLYSSNPEKAIEQFQESFRIDSNFYAPLFGLVPLYERLRMEEELAEVLKYLEENEYQFSKWEKLKFDITRLAGEGKYLEAALLNERLFQLDPSDAASNYSAAFYYNNANHPAKALEIIHQMDPRYIDDKGQAISWRSTQAAFANYRLGDYKPILELAENYSAPKYFTVLAVQHLKALVRLDSTEALANAFQNYKEKGVYSPSGKLDLPDHILLIICNELLLTGKTDLLKTYALKLEAWLNENKVADFPHHIPDVYNNYPLRQMEVRGFVPYYLGNYAKAISYWQQEIIPETNWADLIERASRLGVCFAKIGQLNRAEAELQKIMAFQIDHGNFEAHQLYYSSRILATLNRKEEAVDNIRKALDKGFIFFRPAVLDGDPFLLNLYDHPPFVELINPKSY